MVKERARDFVKIKRKGNLLTYTSKDIERDFGINSEVYVKATEAERQKVRDYFLELFYQNWAMHTIRWNYDGEDDTLNDDFVELLVRRLKQKGEVEYKQVVAMYRTLRGLRNA